MDHPSTSTQKDMYFRKNNSHSPIVARGSVSFAFVERDIFFPRSTALDQPLIVKSAFR